jgi:hypothetical protein
MGVAWLDMVAGGDVEAVLADLRDGSPTDEPTRLQASRGTYDGGSRIAVYSDGIGYGRLAELVVAVVRRTGVVRRAVVVLDHDEYGAEHIVVAPDGAGGVHRLHHVFVYPSDEDRGEGEPSLTDVPAGAGPGATPGALVDDAAARTLTAELYGISRERMDVAAARSADAHKGLQIVGEPVKEWLDAFGVETMETDGGSPVNLRPGPIWRDVVAGSVVPRLPGDWLVRDYDLVRLPAAPVLCVVLPGDFSGNAVLYPMYVPDAYGTLQYAVRLRHAVDDSPPDADALLRELTDDALPFFDRYGHPDGLWQLCSERVADQPADRANPHDLRCRAATEVMLGRYAEAAATYGALATAWAGEQTEWLRDIVEEARVRRVLLQHDPAVVHEALTETMNRQLADLGVAGRQ